MTWGRFKNAAEQELIDAQKWSVSKSVLSVCAMGALFGAIELALVFALRVRLNLHLNEDSLTSVAGRRRSRSPLAGHLNGSLIHDSPVRWRLKTLLRYLFTPYCPWYILHICRDRCRRGRLLAHLRLYVLPFIWVNTLYGSALVEGKWEVNHASLSFRSYDTSIEL